MARLAVALLLVLPLCACGQRAPAPSAAPARDLATALRRDGDGLVAEKAADGSEMVHLGGRFQHAPIAHRHADGTTSVSCAGDAAQVPRALGGQAPAPKMPRQREVR
jgi:hypothetical protein